MRPKQYKLLTFIIGNINWSISHIQYERFKRERSIAMQQDLRDYQRVEEKEKEGRYRECTSIHQERTKEPVKTKKGFINDVIWMLEYNHNGLMQLIFYSIHLTLLAAQVIISILYTSFPTIRDSSTNEFINPWLRLAENVALTDFIYKFDSKGRFNQMVGLLACQSLILRLRSLYSRLKTAKINKHLYKDINIVEMQMASAEELRYNALDVIRFSRRIFSHKCDMNSVLRGPTREKRLKFNRQVRCLSKIDRIYYHNRIDFDDCFEGETMYADYHKLTDEIDRKQRANFAGMNDSNNNEHDSTRKQWSWWQYSLSFNMPAKINFLPAPDYIMDLTPSIYSLFLYLIGSIFAITFISSIWIAATKAALKYHDWERDSFISLIYCMIRANLTFALIILNVYDCALLHLCSMLFLSRSRKVAKLLEIEIEFYRHHLKKLSILEENNRVLVNFKQKNVLNSPKTSTDFEESNQNEKFSTNQKHVEFSSIRQEQSSNSEARRNPIDNLILNYKNCVSQSTIEHFNENISYLLDLVEVVQFEFNDHKRYFTLLLDINIIFGTLGCSISLGMLLEIVNTTQAFFAAIGFLAFLLPMLFSLSIGASSEAAVSIVVARQHTRNVTLQFTSD